MLPIIFLGLIATLTSVSGDCIIGTQNVNINWNKFSVDRLWYYRRVTPGPFESGFRCAVQKYGSPVGNISPITVWAIDISTQSPVTACGYATNRNSTSWEEFFPQQSTWTGQNYPIAVDYDRYFIFKYCYSESNQLNIFVAYRTPFPDKDTVDIVKKKLEENNIEYSQLADWSWTNCTLTDFSTEEGCSA